MLRKLAQILGDDRFLMRRMSPLEYGDRAMDDGNDSVLSSVRRPTRKTDAEKPHETKSNGSVGKKAPEKRRGDGRRRVQISEILPQELLKIEREQMYGPVIDQYNDRHTIPRPIRGGNKAKATEKKSPSGGDAGIRASDWKDWALAGVGGAGGYALSDWLTGDSKKPSLWKKVVKILAAGAGAYGMHRLGRAVIGEKEALAVKQAQYEDVFGDPFARLAQMRALRLVGKSAVGAARTIGRFAGEAAPYVARYVQPGGLLDAAHSVGSFIERNFPSTSGTVARINQVTRQPYQNGRAVEHAVRAAAGKIGDMFEDRVVPAARKFIDDGIAGTENAMVDSGDISKDDLDRFNRGQATIDSVAGPAINKALVSYVYGLGPAISLGTAGIDLATNVINADTARRNGIKQQNIDDLRNAQPVSGGDFWPSGAPRRQGEVSDPYTTAHSQMSLQSYGK